MTAPSGAVRRLFGRSPNYSELFRLFALAGENVERSTALLAEVMRAWPDDEGRRHELVEREHVGDRVTHDIIHHLYTRSVTPFDRDDVLALASELDDVVDYAEEVADFMALYQVEAAMEAAIELADVLEVAGREIGAALGELYQLDRLSPHLIELDRLEDEGDRIERAALAALFQGGIDPMVVIRWKDIYERLEQAIDSCGHVAHVLEGIVVKNA